jgi:hypothetical protein
MLAAIGLQHPVVLLTLVRDATQNATQRARDLFNYQIQSITVGLPDAIPVEAGHHSDLKPDTVPT